MSELTRRDFVSRTSGVLLGAGASWAMAAADGDDAEWAFPLLGDLHFDRLEHHDMPWLEREHPGDVSQVRNYSRVTTEFMPRLFAAVRDRVAASRLPVPLVLQLGDLIEGLCGSEARARQQADDALAFVRSMRLPAPILFTKGNHDVTGPGAAAIYDRVLVPFLAGQADAEVRAARYTRRRGGTLLVFFDAYDRGSLDWFEAVMRDQRPRRLLFVIHPPVVPYNARSTWHVYSSPTQTRQRERLLELLGGARAVVLSGHLHKYSFLVRRTERGRFSQLAISSVATDAAAAPRNLLEGERQYGPDLVRLEPRHSPDTEDRRRALLEAERPFIERFEYAETWGHAWLRVSGDRVRAEVFRGLDQGWKELDLTTPLG